MSEIPQNRSLSSFILSDRLAVVAYTLFVVYLISVLAFSVPPRLLDPLWQLTTIKLLIEAAPIPLLGLALLHLAAYLSPQDDKLQRRRDGLARLAVLACLGFLLIVPLQGFTVWRSFRLSNAIADQQQASATQRAETVRQAIQQAGSAEDLQKRLLALQRPDLQIRLNADQFPSLPLPELKQRLLFQLDQAEGQFKARFSRLDPATNDRLLRESLRVMVSSIALAIAFAALAQRRNSAVPFLVELPSLLARTTRGGQSSAAMPFRNSAAKREEEFFASLAPEEEDPRPGP
ncbi:HpsJ family protein [Cyanobium sp. Candia 9D4]|jgi:hypothetical protein|uniref:HpsJ family protein n=1 Tax=Cyanobium sp. Candia 9D4 TaxID=2823707 RepID=UPI0020CEB6A5|nr:HpsJ family protein [Cyanobium sp. Candia 9D4]MCP9933785.1 HpsJ family protein [Cyanobium sp. Candia 9D4]